MTPKSQARYHAGKVIGGMVLSDYYQKIGESTLSASMEDTVYANIAVLNDVISKHGDDEAFSYFLVENDYKFKVASWNLATQCTAARRNGMAEVITPGIEKRHCDKLNEYGFVKSDWCEPYSSSLYAKNCGDI